jgi:hypothetical protein
MRFQLSNIQVLWSLHHCLRIWVLVSVIRGLAVAALPWMLNLWSSRRTVFVEIGHQDEYLPTVLLSPHAIVLWIFETILLNLRRSLSASVYFHPLFLFADVVFLRFVYSDVTLETVAIDTPNNVAVFVADAPAKRAPTICPLSKSDKSPIFRFFRMDCYSTQSLMHWHEHYIV